VGKGGEMKILGKYTCDLCRGEIDPKEEDCGFGIFWGHNKFPRLIKSITDFEHHICISCFQGIRVYGVRENEIYRSYG
jgi:hypothetical protein